MSAVFQRLRTVIEEHPAALLLGYMAFSVVLWTAQCSLLQNILSLDALEAIAWGGEFSWGHSKHPPLSGWAAEFFSRLSCRADWGSYLGCQLMLAIGVWFVYLTVRLFADRWSSATSAALLYCLFYYLPSWMKFSTYFVEIAIVPMAGFCFFRAQESAKRQLLWWLLFGALCGLGILNKYSFGLQIVGFALVVLALPGYRRSFFSPGPYLAFAVFCAVLAPHLRWLIANDFCCFEHVGERMHEERRWYDTFNLLALILYPFFSSAVALCIARFPGWRNAERKSVDRALLIRTLLPTLVPSVVYLVLDVTGNSVIMMWFCTTASWTGAAVVAAFPWRITPAVWRRVFVLLLILTAAVFTGTTLDLLLRSGRRLHLRPEAIVEPSLEFWHRRRSDPVPAVCGSPWFTGVIKNYSAERPPVCGTGDPVRLRQLRPLIDRRGALLIGDKEELDEILAGFGCRAVRRKIRASYRALWGRRRSESFLVGYLPPLAERQTPFPGKKGKR